MKNEKIPFWKQLWFTSSIFTCIALFLFSLAVLIRKFNENDLWNATTTILGLLGILLTAGAAFATVSAIISYVSVNDKLKSISYEAKKAEEDLRQISYLFEEKKKNREQH